MKEIIPFSSNIFHDKGDLRSRAVVAMDIAMTCIKELYPDDQHVENGALKDIRRVKEGLLATGPAVFDVRAELRAALIGDNTAPPQEAESAEGVLFCIGGSHLTGCYRSYDDAEKARANLPGSFIGQCTIDDAPRR